LLNIPLKYYSLAFYCSLLVVLLASCSMEKKLAQTFIKTPPAIDLQLFTPDILFKFNHKGEEIEGFKALSDTQQDSALYVSSKFMQFVEDSIYLEQYMNSFIEELRALGFNVFLDHSVDSFLQRQPQSYIVNISQVQLDEYKFPLVDSEPFEDTVYTKTFQLNSVDASAWFELSKINSPNPKKTVLYSSFTASDGFDGNFLINTFTNDIQYRYKIDSLKLRDIYDLAGYAGWKDASYLFDFFMNQYIAFHLPKGIEPLYFLHYDRYHKTLSPTEDEKFDILDAK
jgi:hypothetical protein